MFNQLESVVQGVKELQECDEKIGLELPASFEFLSLLGDPIRALLAQVDTLNEEQQQTLAYNLELAAYEACTNIVEHAYAGEPGKIELFFCLDKSRTVFTIGLHDSGRSFDFEPDAVRLPELDQFRGYGLYLIQQLVDELQYWSLAGDNHWRLIKRL